MFLILKGKTGTEVTIDSTKIDVFEPEGDGCILQMQYGAVHVTDSYDELNRVLCAVRPSNIKPPSYLSGIDVRELAAKYSAERAFDGFDVTPGWALTKSGELSIADGVPMIQVNALFADDKDGMYRPRSFDPLRINLLDGYNVGGFARSEFFYNGKRLLSDETVLQIQAKIDKVTK